ncbi:8-amino-7-oxononanoate synthase [Alicyclobacillus tolerans]|uniref:8-amino-7-oxononanoate synthase n=1 Tax=Alicyclobacillus tolerans TaxID=90970 RepID=UPI0023510F3D|nr:8-amino-7-oxononanoate synthase [Alicyclobacillus tolerans]MCF8563230.1 8-amino-7-oxononanoate synthase [Alicyclobacillus tolerans]
MLAQELKYIRDAGLYRSFRTMESASDAQVQVESQRLIMCASNNYLGLANHPELMDAACNAIRRFGTGSSGSRLITGNTQLHDELEAALSRFKKTEAAIVFNTGFMANLAVLSTLVKDNDVIFSDELNHASIIDGCRLSRAHVVVYRHNDMADLEDKLIQHVQTRRQSNPGAEAQSFRALIVTDGVFSMDGDIALLPKIVELAERFKAWVMVDDAHATGVLGTHGGGTADYYGLPAERVHVQLGTLSKALGAEGGYVAGSQVLIDYLRNRARPFIFSTALSPGVVATAKAAMELVEREPQRRTRLQDIARSVREGLTLLGFRVLPGVTPIIPVIIGDPQRAVDFGRRLEAMGVFAPAVRPPSVPAGTSRIRLTLMATHSDEDVHRILDAFARIGSELEVIA